MQSVTYGAIENNGPIMVFLHGFPGLRSKQNRDFAETAVRELGGVAYVALHSGLGVAPGKFSFTNCLHEVREFFKGIVKEASGAADVHGGSGTARRPVYLVGHSWGGLMSLILASEYPDVVDRVVLLSPLLDFRSLGDVRAGFAEMVREHAQLEFGSVEELANDYHHLARQISVEEIIEKIPSRIRVLLLQSQGDQVTPTEVARKRLAHFKNRPEFVEVDVNHSFLGHARGEVGERIVSFFR
jgi:pimeloyl-ACP methyl ester carboxylesterase